MPSLFRSFTLAGILAGSLAGSVSAQDAGGESSTVIYTADYFDQWQPITAQDMLDRIPGQGAAGGLAAGHRIYPATPKQAVADWGAVVAIKCSSTASVSREKTIQLAIS
jgi:hypothetical protein